VSARRGSASALANALPQLFGTLPTGVLANAVAIALPQPRGLTPSPLVSVAGEWESNRLSKRCFVNHGGAYAPRSCFARGWPPAELRLLRCTNAHARGAAGVSPPWFWRRTCTRASAIVRQTAAGELADAVAIAFVQPRGTHAPRSWSRASGSRVRTCAESSSQAPLPQPRGAYAPRSWSRAVRPPTELRLLRCTNAHARGGRVSARRGCASDSATTIHQTFARCHRAREQQRRASARRGSTTHMQGKSQTTSRCAFT